MTTAYDHLAFTSFRIIEDSRALKETEERTFPASRHRSRRIRKKLIKRFGTEFVMVPAAFSVMGGPVIVHPDIADELRKAIEAKKEADERRVLAEQPRNAGPDLSDLPSDTLTAEHIRRCADWMKKNTDPGLSINRRDYYFFDPIRPLIPNT